MVIDYGKSTNERLGLIERRLAAIEKHVGMNGSRFLDTEPAPATEPENPKPEEA